MHDLFEPPNHNLFEGWQAEPTATLSSSSLHLAECGTNSRFRKLDGRVPFGKGGSFKVLLSLAVTLCGTLRPHLLPVDIGMRDELQNQTPFVAAALFSTPIFRISV